MRENGKIYVVVAVLAIIFVGIVVYLISIDRKTNALQKQLEDLKK
jgi:CcmD family protein